MADLGETFSTSDLSRKSGDIIAQALRHPVTITQRNKLPLVLMNIEDYDRLRQRAETRRLGTIESMPDDILDEFEAALEAYATDGDGDRS